MGKSLDFCLLPRLTSLTFFNPLTFLTFFPPSPTLTRPNPYGSHHL